MPLHLSKVAVGCDGLDALAARVTGRTAAGEAPIDTRFRPKRADEVVGGSLFWIVRHRLVARQEILGFGETERGRCVIRLAARLVPVRARIKRAHQGWRYLEPAAAPADLIEGEADSGVDALPPALAAELFALGLL